MDKIFISFPFDEVYAATYIAQQLKKNSNNDCEISIYPQNVNGKQHWKVQIQKDIETCDVFIFIVGNKINAGQLIELDTAIKKEINIWRINTVSGNNAWNKALDQINHDDIHKILETDFESWDDLTGKLNLDGTLANIFRKNNISWKYNKYINDGLPLNSQIFNYEKKIIDFYYNHNNFTDQNENEKSYIEARNKILLGVPAEWPIVRIKKERPNLELKPLDDKVQEEIGDFRKETYVLSAALSEFHQKDKPCPCNFENKLIFPEAGPRKSIFSNKPKDKFRIGILVSGGIAPGINALIDGITRRQYFYANKLGHGDSLEILGLMNGFKSLEQRDQIQFKLLFPTEGNRPQNSIVTSNITNEGGSIIGTSRYEHLVNINFIKRLKALKDIVVRLSQEGIRILYIIGGEGSMKAAQSIQKRADQYIKDEDIDDWDLSVVGIPKTMDNDILWVWQTFGFMSAVEKAREFIEYLYVESKSNPRWGIVQLFGSNSGFVVSHAVLACKSDICNLALIPEMDYNLENVVKYIRDSGKDNGLIILAETAVPKDIAIYLENDRVRKILTDDEVKAIQEHREEGMRKIDCHVNDDLRSGVVKIIAWAIEKEAGKKRPFINEPRHLLRSIPPSTIDIITASRLGTLAVDNAMAGYYGFMISQWLTEFCLIPLELVVLGRKRIPPEGIFFKSVIKKTGQPQSLV
jgi:6-phosphofructokinase 1